jgi:hypothetical protein
MSKGDLLVERGAARLQAFADRAAARGDGVGEWLSEELRNDAAFPAQVEAQPGQGAREGQRAGEP